MEPWADVVFGQGSADRACHVLAGLFRRRGNRFGHDTAVVAERAGQPAGLLLGYPGDEAGRRSLDTARDLLVVAGPRYLFCLALRSGTLLALAHAPPDRFFVSNLAVLSSCRRSGVATALLAWAEEKARSLGLSGCALDVDAANLPARRLYARAGYRVEATRGSWLRLVRDLD